MSTIKNNTNLRYQVYGLDNKGNLSNRNPITRPIHTKERCYKYFNECAQCAIVSIDEYGSIVEIIDKNLTLINETNKKPKTLKHFSFKR